MSEMINRIELGLAAILASHYGNTPPKDLTVRLAKRADGRNAARRGSFPHQ